MNVAAESGAKDRESVIKKRRMGIEPTFLSFMRLRSRWPLKVYCQRKSGKDEGVRDVSPAHFTLS